MSGGQHYLVRVSLGNNGKREESTAIKIDFKIVSYNNLKMALYVFVISNKYLKRDIELNVFPF